jgi:non-specific serine/threonine protein kinase/serine/threonine-protein kinase
VTSDEHINREATLGSSDRSAESTLDIGTALSASIVIEQYHLLHRIGVGGMGEVWLAEQKEPIRRRVAVKLIKAGMDSREVIRRIESERQTLALMDHPAIAKVLDAGSTQQGAPYFVMEYVAGVSITDYCDKHRLSTRERLELFIHVCDGVQHAHQKAIIHRDLKPSNILVAEVDNTATPKIIDFGIAKALTQQLGGQTMFTQAGSLVGTPEYMSPEQASSMGEDIDTRTDVYSLGIIFYELLAGARPIELEKVVLEEFLRRLREDEPQKPSTKITTDDPSTSTEVARKRDTEPQELAKQLQGELDAIALKALEKERSRRYASASEFAADIRRYLNNEPVLAVPPSLAYRARKFSRRHRAGLMMLSAFVLVLVVAAAISIWQGIVARRQRDRADTEAATAKAVNEFLQNDLLSQADPATQSGPDAGPDPEIKVRTLLDRAAARVSERFADKPLVEAAIQDTIGHAYEGLGLYAQSEQHLRRAYELSASYRGSDAPETLDMLMGLSGTLREVNKYADAVTAAKAAFEAEARTLGPEDPRTVVAMQNLGAIYLFTNQDAEAEPLLKKALEIQTRRNGYDNIDTLNTSDSLAQLYIDQFRYAEASMLLTKGLVSYRRVFGSDHPFTSREMFGLGKVLQGKGDYTEAEKVFAEALAIEQRTRGKRHPDTLRTAERLGRTLIDARKFDEGIHLLESTLGDFRETLGPGDYDTLLCEVNLGAAYDSKGDRVRAEQTLRSALQGLRAVGKDGEADAANAAELLGVTLVEQRKYSQAEPVLRQALTYREEGDKEGWQRYRAQAFLGAALSGLKKYPEAEKFLLSGQQGLEQRVSRMPADQKRWVRYSAEQMVDLYSGWGKPNEAAQWRAKLQTL